VLDLLEVVLVRALVHGELLPVLLELALGLLQLERELGGGLAVAGLEVGLGLGLELAGVGLALLDLAATRSTSPRYCSRPTRPSLSCSTALSYSYCIWAIGSASQKKLASLFS
jgi:hypothetical protein